MLADEALVADDHVLLDAGALANVAGAPDDRAAHACARPDVHVVVHDRALQLGVVLHDDVRAEHRVRPKHCAGLHARVVADEHGAEHLGVRRDVCPFAEPHAVAYLEAGDLEMDSAVQDVVVGAAIRLERADVLPIALDDVPDELQPSVQHRREYVAREVDDLAFGDEVEDLRLEHVDVGVDRVREHLAPGRLLEEALDRPVLTSDDDPELHGILNALEGDRRKRLARLVRLHHFAEVDVGQRVAGNHEERLVELFHGVAHRARGAER